MVNQSYRGISTNPMKYEFKPFIQYTEAQNSDKVAEYWRNTFMDCDCSYFPALPLSVRQPVADSDISHKIPWLDTLPQNFTITTLVRAAWALLASYMTNSENVVFGITKSGRTAPISGINEILGPTVATVPFYVKIPRSQTALDYLAAV